MPNPDQEGQQPTQPIEQHPPFPDGYRSPISRRQLLGEGLDVARRTTGFGLALAFLASLKGDATPKPSSPQPDQQPQSPSSAETEAAKQRADFVNNVTAYVGAATFGSIVLRAALPEGSRLFQPLGRDTILQMGAVEAGRLTALHLAGANEEANEEQSGLIESLTITAALTAVADIASDTTIAPEVLREKRAQHERRQPTLQHVLQEAGHDLQQGLQEERRDMSVPIDFSHLEPMQHLSIQELQQGLELTRRQIERVATEALGAAAVVGPLLTSYISSSAAEQATTEMTQLLTRAYYQQRLLELKTSPNDSNNAGDQVLFQEAFDKALERINGKGGWAHMLITIASNGFSNGIIGGPPFITSLMQSRSIEEVAEHFGIMSTTGIVYSDLIASMSLAGFLESTKVFTFPDHIHDRAKFYGRIERDFLNNQRRTLTKLKEAVAEDRNVAFGGRSHFAPDIHQRLFTLIQNPTENNLQELTSLIHSMNDPFISFNLIDYLKAKQDALAHAGEHSRLVRTLTSQGFRDTIFDREQQTDSISHALLGAMEVSHDHADWSLEQRLAQIIPNDEGLRQQLITSLAQGGNDAVVTSLEKAYDQLEEAGPEAETLLSEQALEQSKALLTQLPAVPSLVRTAQSVIGQLTEKMGGSQADRIKAITRMVLLSDVSLSSVADNVAAMLYARQVLNDSLANAFGDKKWYTKYPQLDRFVRLSTLMAAVWGGAHSRIGNGSNFILQGKAGSIDTYGNIHLENADINFARSFANPYSFLQSGPGLFGLFMYLDKTLADSGIK